MTGWEFWWQSVWFFLPAKIANMCPGWIRAKDRPWAKRPTCQKWFGRNKTWGAFYAGPLGALATIYIQRLVGLPHTMIDYSRWDLWLVGLLFGLGAIVGDHAKSFLKRRRGIAEGEPWVPWDWIDYAIGALAFVTPFLGWVGWRHVTVILVTVLFASPAGNRIGYKKSWY